MAIVVGTNSYVTEAELTAYATARGVTISGDTEQLLIKAMDYIEAQIYKGDKYDTDTNQPLEFPRTPTDQETATTVPPKIETAQIVAALLIDSGEELFSTVDRAVKREKIDVIEVEYMDGASETKRYRQLDILLSPYLASSGKAANGH